MRKTILLAALMCMLVPLASYAIPITRLNTSDSDLRGSLPSSSGTTAAIILSRGFAIAPPSANPPSITLGKPSQPGTTKTTKGVTLKKKKCPPAVNPTPPLIPPNGNLPFPGNPMPPLGPGQPGNGGQTSPAPVPEPATMVLLGTGLMGAAALRKFF